MASVQYVYENNSKIYFDIYNNFALQNIESFFNYLQEWEKEAKNEKNKYEFITDSTCYGWKISLQAAFEICKFLVDECEFQYLMTARLNQDNLEVSDCYINYSTETFLNS